MPAFTPPSRYQVHDQLGHGGFSTVYRAWDQSRGEWVAIKVFLKSDDEGAILCRKEYDRTNALRHPNIIRFYDFGVATGAPYIVMPFYEKGTMQDRLGEVTEEDLWQLIFDIGNALAYIHSLTPPVLHNDLKPDNFLIGEDGSYILADFGISMALNEKLLRSRDMLHGEPSEEEMGGRGPMAYQAPELFKFRDQIRQTPVKASDIWAFGASLYEIATGEAPFDDQGGLYELVEVKENNSRLLDILNPLPSKFSDVLNNLIFDCLALSTWDRPQASALCAEARQQLGREPVVRTETPLNLTYPAPRPAPPKNQDTYASRRPKPSKRGWQTAVAVAASLIAGSGGMYWFMHKDNVFVAPEPNPYAHQYLPTQTEPEPATRKRPIRIPVETVADRPEENDFDSDRQVPTTPVGYGDQSKRSVESRPTPPTPPAPSNDGRAAHRYHHYVFTFSNSSAAQEARQELRSYFRGQPVSLYQKGTFSWEVYVGNFRNHEEMNTFQQQYPDFDFPKSRHGDAYRD